MFLALACESEVIKSFDDYTEASNWLLDNGGGHLIDTDPVVSSEWISPKEEEDEE